MNASNSKAARGRTAVVVTTIGATVAGVAGATAIAVSLAGHAQTPSAAATQDLSQQAATDQSTTTDDSATGDDSSTAPWVAVNPVQPPTQSSGTGSTSSTHAS